MATKFPPSNNVPAKDVTLDMNMNSNPKQLTYLAKRTLKRLEKDYVIMYDEDGSTNENYCDDVMCARNDVERILEDHDDRREHWKEIEHCNQIISIAANQLERAQQYKRNLLSYIDYYGEQSSYTIARQ